MKFITITCTVTERIKKTDGTQSIRISKVFSQEHNPETGTTYTVQYKDCYIPFRWYTGTVYNWRYKGSTWKSGSKSEMNKDKYYGGFESKIVNQGNLKQLTFSEDTPELVQVYNPETKEMEEYNERFKFYIPEWISKNLKKWRTSKIEQTDFYANDDNPITIIEEKSAEATKYSDERERDLQGSNTAIYGSSLEMEIREEFDGYSSNIDTNEFLKNLKRTDEIESAFESI